MYYFRRVCPATDAGGENRESGSSPERSRHCNRRQSSHFRHLKGRRGEEMTREPGDLPVPLTTRLREKGGSLPDDGKVRSLVRDCGFIFLENLF